jgi:hypothetical protein
LELGGDVGGGAAPFSGREAIWMGSLAFARSLSVSWERAWACVLRELAVSSILELGGDVGGGAAPFSGREAIWMGSLAFARSLSVSWERAWALSVSEAADASKSSPPSEGVSWKKAPLEIASSFCGEGGVTKEVVFLAVGAHPTQSKIERTERKNPTHRIHILNFDFMGLSYRSSPERPVRSKVFGVLRGQAFLPRTIIPH